MREQTRFDLKDVLTERFCVSPHCLNHKITGILAIIVLIIQLGITKGNRSEYIQVANVKIMTQMCQIQPFKGVAL